MNLGTNHILYMLQLTLANTLATGALKSSATLDRHGHGAGFHRNIQSSFDLSCDGRCCSEKRCKAQIVERISDGLFVDTYELQLRREYKILIDGDVDVETPAHLSKDFNMHVFTELICADEKSTVDVSIPMHLRYHKPNNGGDAAYIELRNPLFLVRCPGVDLPYPTVEAPCDSANSSACSWSNVRYDCEKTALVFLIPVGDFLHVWFTLGFTVLFAIGGCIYITYRISLRGLPLTRLKYD